MTVSLRDQQHQAQLADIAPDDQVVEIHEEFMLPTQVKVFFLVPAEEAGLIAIEGGAVFRQTPLAEGDRVMVLPAVFGG